MPGPMAILAGPVDWEAFLWGDDWRTANPDHRLFNDPATVVPAMAADVQSAASTVTSTIGQAVTSTATSQVSALAPYLIAGGLVWLAVQLRRAR